MNNEAIENEMASKMASMAAMKIMAKYHHGSVV
jgi:hypothetical protein